MIKNLKKIRSWPIPRYLKLKLLLVALLTFLTSLSSNFSVVMLAPLARVVMKNENPSNIWEKLFSKLLFGYDRDEKIVMLCIAFLFVSFLKFALQNMYSYGAADLIYSFRKHYTVELFNKYVYATNNYLQKTKLGVILSNIYNQPALGADCINIAIQFLRISISIVITSVFLFITDYKISLVVFSAVIGLYFLASLAKYSFKKIGHSLVKTSQDLSAVGTESLGALKQVKVYNLEEEKKRAFLASAEERKVAYRKNYFFQMMPTNSYEFIFAIGAVVFVAGYIKIIGNIEAILPSLIVLAGLSMALFSNFFNLIEKLYNFYSFFPALDLTMSLASEEIEQEDINRGIEFEGLDENIVFKDFTFKYPDGNPLFEKLNLEIPKGKITAIIGESGCGKSTLLDLIAGFYMDYEGELRIGKNNLKDLKISSFRQKIGFVPQASFLFDDTIENNISIFTEAKSGMNIEKAAELADAHKFIQELPEGYKTELNNSSGLSGGQKQRICIARALFRSPEIIIFDEATSALDPETAEMIDKNIKNISKGKTVVLVTHRESTLKLADNIINLSNHV